MVGKGEDLPVHFEAMGSILAFCMPFCFVIAIIDFFFLSKRQQIAVQLYNVYWSVLAILKYTIDRDIFYFFRWPLICIWLSLDLVCQFNMDAIFVDFSREVQCGYVFDVRNNCYHFAHLLI